MVNNSNAASTRVGNILRNGTDGETGLYLKQLNGAVQANLQEGRIFEPASSINMLENSVRPSEFLPAAPVEAGSPLPGALA